MNIKEKIHLFSKTELFSFSILLFFAIGLTCCKTDIDSGIIVSPPDPSLETKITSYYPDSGGVATSLILHGTNFGTDTSYLKVYVNGKKAAIVGCDGEAIYAIVPSRADSGVVKLVVGKDEEAKEFTYPTEFKYFFRENVTTVCGQNGIAGTDDGDVNTATLRRVWNIAFDIDGTMFFIDEGRGQNADGGIRKFVDGNVETIMRCSAGVLQSPTVLGFNLGQDTLFLVQTIYNANSMSTDAAISYMTRNEGFSVIKPYVRTSLTFRATALAVHPITGNLFFNSRADGYLYKANKATGGYDKIFQLNGTDTELRMVFDPLGEYLYIMVQNKHCIYRAKYNKTTATVENPELFAGQWGVSGYLNGIGTAAQFNAPSQGTFDEDGNLYVPDKDNHCIRKITPNGMVSLFAGKPSESGYKDGSPLESQFKLPECVMYNPDDRGWYVADRDNSLIRKILVE